MENIKTHKHPWKSRFIVSIILLVLAFLGLIITDVTKDGGWIYWRIITPIFAIVSLWLSWYLRKRNT